MISHELEVVSRRIQDAKTYMDVFGAAPEKMEPSEHVKRTFRRLSRTVHPDSYRKSKDKAVAEEAFAKLGHYHRQAMQAVANGQYGKTVILATVTTKKGIHNILATHATGDLCSTYRTDSQLSSRVAGFCKVAVDAGDNDLVQTEVTALKRLHGPDADPRYTPFVPELLDTFMYATSGSPARAATVTCLLKGFYTLDQVRAAFPTGLDPLHMAWIWRRLLVTLGSVHDLGVIHGAVLPRHVMILPEHHGVVLVDWCYASVADDKTHEPLKAIVNTHKDWYPAEVIAKKPPSPATDLFMAARTMVFLLGGDPITGNLPRSVPKAFRAFFKGCMYEKQALRPQNAWVLLQEFDELLEHMGSPYYPRRFRQFTMPSGVA